MSPDPEGERHNCIFTHQHFHSPYNISNSVHALLKKNYKDFIFHVNHLLAIFSHKFKRNLSQILSCNKDVISTFVMLPRVYII